MTTPKPDRLTQLLKEVYWCGATASLPPDERPKHMEIDEAHAAITALMGEVIGFDDSELSIPRMGIVARSDYGERNALRAEQRQRLTAHTTALEAAKNVPMGVSDWIAHGKKYGYYDFAVEAAKREAREEGQLIGAAKILDSMWTNSYNRCGKENSELIRKEMVYLFGDNWSTTMYDFMLRDGVSKASSHPAPVKTFAQLSRPNQPKQVGGEE